MFAQILVRMFSMIAGSVLFVLATIPSFAAQGAALNFDHVFETGAANTNNFIQDRDGFLWIPTWSGLAKYDGYGVKMYATSNSAISGNSVMIVYEDRDGLLWIGTAGNGADTYDKETDTFTSYTHDPDNPRSLSDNAVNQTDQTILHDREGTIWIGTQNGLNLFDKASRTFTVFRHDDATPDSLIHNNVWAVYEDRDGDIWIGTQAGLDRYDKATRTFMHYTHDPSNPNSLSDSYVKSIVEDDQGILWIGTNRGLNAFDKDTKQCVRYLDNAENPASEDHLSSPEVFALYKDSTGMIWISTGYETPSGVMKFDPEMRKFLHYRHNPDDSTSLRTDKVVCVIEDQAGIIWINHNEGFVDKYDPESQKFTFYAHDPAKENSIGANLVTTFYEDRQGILWIGTYNGGLTCFDRKQGLFTVYEKTIYPTLIHEDRDGTFWVSTLDKLGIFDREQGQFIRYYEDIRGVMTLIEDQQDPDTIWFMTQRYGMYKYHKPTEAVQHYANDPNNPNSLSHNWILNAYQDTDGIIWIGTQGGGLNRFDPVSETFESYQNDPDDPNSLGSNDIYDLYEDSAGKIWISTGSDGVNVFDKTAKTFQHYSPKDGFPGSSTFGTLEDENGNMWICSSSGLIKLDPRIGDTKLYTKEDGVVTFIWRNAYQTRDGMMWFGGLEGANAFQPGQITDNPYVPPVHLTALKQGGEDMPLGKSVENVKAITLDWRNNFFEFEFAALNYTKPLKNQYQYFLEGFDKDWFDAGTRRFGRYSNIPGGTYSLRIKGSNNDGVWNEDGLAIAVTVTPPFWETWWFRIAAVALIAAVTAGGVGLRLRAVQAQKRRLQTLVDERTAELNNSLRTITDSVNYAKRIQESALPSQDYVKTVLPESFVLSLPRDVVGGDVYFAEAFDDGVVVAVMDCTGHGVPGAFMSLIASSALRRIAESGMHDPAAMLQELNRIMKRMLHQDTEFAESDDGLDAAICFVPNVKRNAKQTVVFAGANLPLLYVQDGAVQYIKGDRQSLGYKRSDPDFVFTNHTISATDGITCYLFSDGYQDQVGGEKGKRFGRIRLQELLQQIHTEPFAAQRERVLRVFHEYRGDRKPLDDVTMISFRC